MKGWHNKTLADPIDHGLAAQGVRTRSKIHPVTGEYKPYKKSGISPELWEGVKKQQERKEQSLFFPERDVKDVVEMEEDRCKWERLNKPKKKNVFDELGIERADIHLER